MSKLRRMRKRLRQGKLAQHKPGETRAELFRRSLPHVVLSITAMTLGGYLIYEFSIR